jgi:hypothetical protein
MAKHNFADALPAVLVHEGGWLLYWFGRKKQKA